MTDWEKVKKEIIKTYNEEAEHDKRWAQGLKYSLKIIDKYTLEDDAPTVIEADREVDG